MLRSFHRCLPASLLCCLGGVGSGGQIKPPTPETGFISGIKNPAIQRLDEHQEDCFDLAAICLLYYDSNLGLSPDTGEFQPDGGMVAMLNPGLTWHRRVAGLNTDLFIRGGYNQYFDHPEYDGGSYSIGGGVEYDAGNWDLAGRFTQGYTEGVNRYYGASLAQYQFGAGASLDYRISPKTAIEAQWESSWLEPDGGYAGTETHSLNVAAMWRYSPLLSVGPGLRFTNTSGEVVEGRTSLGPMISTRYELSRKMAFTGRVGIDCVEFSGGGRDQFLSASMGMNYAPSRLWTVDFSLLRDVMADGSLGGGYREATALKLGVTRAVRRLAVGFDLGYEHDEYSEETGAVSRRPVDFFSAGVNLDAPVFGDRAKLSTFLRFQQSVSDDMTRDWDGVQAGCGLSFNF